MKEKDALTKALAKRDKEIKRLVKDGISKSQIARYFDISRERVRQVANRK